jgi:DNA-binding NtrC family response regulator
MAPQFTILIIEDDAGVTALIYEVLSCNGYRVITVDSIQEAERALQRFGPAEIHLVISDIHLTPNYDGWEGYALYQRWAVAHPGLPFILISASPQSRELPAVRAQAVRFLEKPFAIHALLHCVQEAIERALPLTP